MVLCKYQHRDVRIPSPHLSYTVVQLHWRVRADEAFFYFIRVTPPRFSTGTLGPTTFGLDLGKSCLAILFINLIFALPPAYL